MKLWIFGPRTITDEYFISKSIHWLCQSVKIARCIFLSLDDDSDITEARTGGARGVDAIGENVIKTEFWRTIELLPAIKPDYARYKRGAPFKRNTENAEWCDIGLGIWDEESRGTKHSIQEAVRLGKPTFVFLYASPLSIPKPKHYIRIALPSDNEDKFKLGIIGVI